MHFSVISSWSLKTSEGSACPRIGRRVDPSTIDENEIDPLPPHGIGDDTESHAKVRACRSTVCWHAGMMHAAAHEAKQARGSPLSRAWSYIVHGCAVQPSSASSIPLRASKASHLSLFPAYFRDHCCCCPVNRDPKPRLCGAALL